MAVKEKNYHIETLRGIAILLVVAGHVIGSTPEGGMKINFPSMWRYIYMYIDYIQMPLFTAIAGWVYAIKPVIKISLLSFLKKKALRLLLPMITVGSLYFFLQYIVPGTNSKGVLNEIWKIYLYPYSIYWYLPSLFIIFILVSIVDINKLASNFKDWSICFILSYIIFIIVACKIIPDSLPNLFSFKGALMQLPYFLIGLSIYRFKNIANNKSLYKLSFLITAAGILMINMEWFYPFMKSDLYTALKLPFIVFALLLIFNTKIENDIFILFGKYAYSIYLFHVFFTGGVRIIMIKVGFESNMMIFFTTFIIASLVPILIDNLLRKFRITDLFLLGSYK